MAHVQIAHVMVPVPEEHVDEVREYLRWQGGPRPISAPDGDAIATVCRDLDAQSRDLLTLVVEALHEVRFFTVAELSSDLGVGTREIVGTILEINERVRLAGGPPVLLFRDALDAKHRLDDRVINITREIAEAIEAADGGKGAEPVVDPS